jgi:hypothetical protein
MGVSADAPPVAAHLAHPSAITAPSRRRDANSAAVRGAPYVDVRQLGNRQ